MSESALKSSDKPTCFVIIGYGCRTDAATGRPLDLDKTFEQLIQPACDAAGINAFRAIDANLTGSIELLMHRWIWLADFVIADMTTLSANVFYELGVRHALRPSTTLLMANRTLMKRIPFDLSSFVVFGYDHPDEGENVVTQDMEGPKFQPESVEALAKRLEALKAVVEGGSRAPSVSGPEERKPESDSPVFVFLGHDLDERARQRTRGAIEPPEWVPPNERRRNENGSLADIIALAREHKRKKNFTDAIRLYRKAIELSRKNKPKMAEPGPNDPHGDRPEVKVDVSLYQSLAESIFLEAIYKHGRETDPFPSAESERKEQIEKFREAVKILKDECALDITADAETLRIAGDIYHTLFRWSRPADYLWPWRLYHWTWFRDFCRKFYFTKEVRSYFERAIDCYERAWSSRDLRLYAERAEKVFRDVLRSTWNPVLWLRYYSESLTARRRANPDKKSYLGPLLAGLALLLLLVGGGLGSYLSGSLVPDTVYVPVPPRPLARTSPFLPGFYSFDAPAPREGDLRAELRQLNAIVTAIQTTIGARTSTTLMETTGDTNGVVNNILSLVRNQQSGEILKLVQRIDGTTTATSATVGDVRKETPEPPSGMNNVASTATTILRELRRLRELHGPEPPPTTLSRTGPAMQFGTLPSAIKGFAYDLKERGETPAPELGLTLKLGSIQQCPSTDAAGGVAGDRVCARARIESTSGKPLVAGDGQSELAREGVLLRVAQGRSRRDPWIDDDSRRAVPFEDAQGFSYLMVVNRDARGLYAVVRRCSQKCK